MKKLHQLIAMLLVIAFALPSNLACMVPKAQRDLFTAADIGNTQTVKKLLAQNYPSNFYIKGQTPLIVAASNKHEDVVVVLLSNGATVSLLDYIQIGGELNQTPQTEQAKFILDLINLSRPLNRSIFSKSVDICTSYLGWKSINTMSDKAKNLIWASITGNHTMVHTLVTQHNVPVNTQDSAQRTALFYATRCGHVDIVETLIKNGAYISIRDNTSKRPYEHALAKGHTYLALYLLCILKKKDNLRNEQQKKKLTIIGTPPYNDDALIDIFLQKSRKERSSCRT